MFRNFVYYFILGLLFVLYHVRQMGGMCIPGNPLQVYKFVSQRVWNPRALRNFSTSTAYVSSSVSELFKILTWKALGVVCSSNVTFSACTVVPVTLQCVAK
jgi:hypothetical protein